MAAFSILEQIDKQLGVGYDILKGLNVMCW